MQTALINGRVMTSRGAIEDCAVLVEGPQIVDVVRRAQVPANAEKYDLGGKLVLPGFIDSQVNGGGGVLFGDSPTVETLRTISQTHARFGTTGFLPTLISGDLKLIGTAIAAVEAAMDARVPGILGIHIEGPFLNPARKGIHNEASFRALDAEAFDIITSFKRGKTLLTLAPEQTTPGMIAKLAGGGVIVSAGHTDATYAETRAALDHGLSGFTHLFNAMSPLRSRAPGVVGAALDDRKSWCGIIADGHHVDPVALRIALAAKGSEKLMLVTDAMPSVGATTKTFLLQGRTITVKDGVCLAPDGTLAGCHLDMASAVRNAMNLMHVNLGEAVNMASRNPAAFLGLSDAMGTISPGQRANFVIGDDALVVSDVWIDGKPA